MTHEPIISDLRVRTPKPRVVGAGLVALDLIMNGKTDTVARFQAGGSCANVMAILSYLGWGAYPVARLNGDEASKIVRADLKRWGVRLTLGALAPGVETPIVVQRNGTAKRNQARHRFSFRCPACGSWLPSHRGITLESVGEVRRRIRGASVFYFDRVSPGAIRLASAYRDRGAVVVFEPSGLGTPRLFKQALAVTHILKYSVQRLRASDLRKYPLSNILLQVETRGDDGLRYLGRFDAFGTPQWRSLKAVAAPRFTDAAGAGDWCTAGVVHGLAQAGLRGFRRSGKKRVRRAIRFAQALAAWNCAYEGARGGMYDSSKEDFRRAIRRLVTRRSANVWIEGSSEPDGTEHGVRQVRRFCGQCDP